jgi:hypothetical protein
MRNPTLQEGGNISCALGYSHNLYGERGSAVDDEVSAHWLEQDGKSCQILSSVANSGSIIRGDKVPDAMQIPLGILA